jgi:surface antigen
MTNDRAASYLIAAISILTVAAPATAQINPFGHDQRITHEDLELIESASAKLYQTDSPQVGASERWSNSNSGNAGTVMLTEVFEKDGMPCRKLRHRIVFEGEKEPAIVIFNRCRVKSGEWKLL